MRWLAVIVLLARTAAADPVLPRVIAAPTAWLPAAGTAIGSAGLDHRGGAAIDVTYGFGGLASLEAGAADDRAHATFRIGAHQDAWFAGQPALVLGVQTGFGHSETTSAYAVASRVAGPLRLHAGAAVLDARVGDQRHGAAVRPLGGLELTPPQYPKTTLLGDIAWAPRLDGPEPLVQWVANWGVRYQALRWGSIELDVRHREGEGIGGSTVMVRVTGVLAL